MTESAAALFSSVVNVSLVRPDLDAGFLAEKKGKGLTRESTRFWFTQSVPHAREEEAGAGMEPAGAERHRRSPKGERAGASESIEPVG